MPNCLWCDKITTGNFCCPDHSNLWYEKNHPEMKCMYCGKQLYPDGMSYKQYLKKKYCSRSCRAHHSAKIRCGDASTLYQLKEDETLLAQKVLGGMLIRIIFDTHYNKYYWIAERENVKLKSDEYFNSIELAFCDIRKAF